MIKYCTTGCSVVIEAAPDEQHPDLRVTGDLDMDAESALHDAVAAVAALVPERVVVDLSEVVFAGSALPNFLARLVGALPSGMPVTVCRPRPMHRWVLDATGMDRILTISSDRPR